jgi:hypothetical protein
VGVHRVSLGWLEYTLLKGAAASWPRIQSYHRLEGALTAYRGNVSIVRWRDRSLHADAFVRFEQGFEDKTTGMTLRAIFPTTDFSFDFQDLDFKRSQ